MNASAIRAVGIDAGSTTTKIVGIDPEGAIVWDLLEPMLPRMELQTSRMVAAARGVAGRDDVPVIATGYGRARVTEASRVVTEITCHGRGVFQALGHGGTLIDIGGQDSKVIVIGTGGRVTDFAMNDKCAAGTGRFVEVMAARMHMELGAFANEALMGTDEEPISSTCTVFAESEIISLLAAGKDLPAVVRGLHRALVKRIASLVRGTSIVPPLMLSGGGAHSPALRALLGEELGQEIAVPERPQLMGAYGAALIGLDT